MFIFGVIVEEIQFFLSSLQVKIKSQQLEKYEIWGGKTLHFPAIDAHIRVEVFTDGLKGICPNCH